MVPDTIWDKMSAKYMWLRRFHTPNYITKDNILIKGKIFVYFGDYNVDVWEANHEMLITFNKNAKNEDCFNYIKEVVTKRMSSPILIKFK
jgi:WD40 repeat protein